jgi:hypothetical protein
MTYTKRKLYAWIVLATMFGGTALFVLIAIEHGLPHDRELWINLWPLITGLGTIASFVVLRKAYRQEPASGFWHLSVGDLLSTSLTFGALLGITQFACDEIVFSQAIFISAVITAVALFGRLMASRLDVREDRRSLFGIALALGTTAVLIVGGLLALLIVGVLIGGVLPSHAWDHSLFRFAIYALVVCIPAAAACYRMTRVECLGENFSPATLKNPDHS